MTRRREGSGWLATREKVQRARELRRAQTPAEERLWWLLRAQRLGVEVRRQHVLLGWIVDFYIPAWRLVIEVDGGVHDTSMDEDAARTEALQAEGVRVLRVSNEEVLGRCAVITARIRALRPRASR